MSIARCARGAYRQRVGHLRRHVPQRAAFAGQVTDFVSIFISRSVASGCFFEAVALIDKAFGVPTRPKVDQAKIEEHELPFALPLGRRGKADV